MTSARSLLARLAALALSAFLALPASAQPTLGRTQRTGAPPATVMAATPVTTTAPPAVDTAFARGVLRFRNIGPFRGGRVAAVTGVAERPTTFYMGATGGGVWKTTDGGSTWANVSDGFFGGASARWPWPRPTPTSSTSAAASRPSAATCRAGRAVEERRRRAHVALRRPAGQPPRAAHRRAPAQPGRRLRGGARRRVPALADARHLPDEGWRGDVAARALRQPGRRGLRGRLRPVEPAHALRLVLARAPHAVQPRIRRRGLVAVEVHRRRHHVDRTHPQPRPAARHGRHHRRRRSRPPTRTASGRRSRPPTAGRSAPTTRARRGGAPPTTAICASARGTTAASSPTRRTRTPSTASTSSSGSPRTAGARFRPSTASATATRTTCGSTRTTRSG